MNDPSSSYAPRSPDLTALPTQPHLQHHHLQYQHHDTFSLPPASTYGWRQSDSPGTLHHQDPFTPPQYRNSYPGPSLPQSRLKTEPSYSQPWTSQSIGSMPGVKEEEQKPAPGEIEGIVVKTKFPVARIKRIVQADEDVGKVAQVTPVVVSKALELFMISLALKSAAEARDQSSKRITGFHLKQAVAKDEQFDFLSEIVSKIPDAPAHKEKETKTSRVKDDSDDDDDDMDDVDAYDPAKKRRGTRKKRKARRDS